MPIHGYPGNVITANPTAPTVSSASGVWTTEQQLQAVSQGNWPGYEYPISRSLRFNSADSAYLNRTPASAGNRRTWTWSGWVKRGALGSSQVLFGSRPTGSSNESAFISFNSSNAIYIFSRNPSDVVEFTATTNAVFRDPSAWYHVLFYLDTTQSTSTNRMALYVNGVQQTFSTSTYPTQNLDCYLNQNVIHQLGSSFSDGYLDGYMTETNFIGGQALTPSSFGLNDPETGVWSPKAYTGSYSGTNSFYLNFSDNSGTTSTTLGKDYSGNGNNWTPNNFSVTAGAGNDSLVDSPTSYGTDTGVGGEVRGNYCTLNPLNKTSGATISNGNLNSAATAIFQSVIATFGMSSGKWYYETTIGTGVQQMIGISTINSINTADVFSGNYSYGYYGSNGNKYVNGSPSAFGASFTANDVIGVAVNLDANEITFYKNNASQGTISIQSGQTYFAAHAHYVDAANNSNYNFGQRAFAYTAPSGFKALCTQNLPTPTIGATSTTQANDYMNVVLYTGNGASRTISGVGFQPDWVWVKARSAAIAGLMYDAVRGATKYLQTNSTAAEGTGSDSLTAFASDGFSLGADTSTTGVNQNTTTYVAWNWKANGAGSSNTAGTITSTVSANTTSGFSIVTWTGNGSSNQTIGHGLGVTPGMIIVKARTQASATNWRVWHQSLTGSTYYLGLNQTFGESSSSTVFNGQSSTTFTVGTDPSVNANTYTFVAYCFAAVAGYSAFGSYTGNGSANGPFVYTGFRPRYVLIKVSSGTTGSWVVWDTARSTYNATGLYLVPDLSNAEAGPGIIDIDILSNGFKIRQVDGVYNANTATYIYAAFAESPFKYALAR